LADLSPEETEILLRSMAMLPQQEPNEELDSERALAILGQLVRALRELRRR